MLYQTDFIKNTSLKEQGGSSIKNKYHLLTKIFYSTHLDILVGSEGTCPFLALIKFVR